MTSERRNLAMPCSEIEAPHATSSSVVKRTYHVTEKTCLIVSKATGVMHAYLTRLRRRLVVSINSSKIQGLFCVIFEIILLL